MRSSKRAELFSTVKTYLSGWILNLGVVPLLLFAAFLFFPAFVFLRSLLFSVTRVLETMSLLLKQPALLRGHFAFCKPKVLSLNKHSVKAVLLSLSTPFLCSATQSVTPKDITLSVGEHYELHLPQMMSFTLSSGDSLSHKEKTSQKSLLLKARQPGKTQIMVWNKDGNIAVYRIYVLDDEREIKLQQIKKKLSVEGIKVNVSPPFIELEGGVKMLKHYLYLKRIIQKHSDLIDNKLKVSKTLSDQIFTRVYQRFFGEYVDHISCQVRGFDLVCQHKNDKNISPDLIQDLSQKLGVTFQQLENMEKMQNYKLRLKLVQMEQMDGQQVNLGLSQLNTRLSDLFQAGIRSVIENNELVLKENNIQLSSLAEPEAIVQSGQSISLEIGSDIPYTITTLQGAAQTQWKFAGLKVDVEIERRGHALEVKYETSFTRPSSGQSISGNKESSTLMIPLGTPVGIFQISFQTLGQQAQSIPLLGDIPILGKIFSSSGNQSNYKNITGVIQIEKHDL